VARKNKMKTKQKKAGVRGWLIFFGIIILLLAGLFWWLSSFLNSGTIFG
jgi:hypothetical protein